MTGGVVRRLEVHTTGASVLSDVEAALAIAASAFHGDLRLPRVDRAGADVLTVWLEGSAKATAAVRRHLAGVKGARVHRETLDMPLGAGDETPGALIYPDRRALARIDPDGRAPAAPASGKPVRVAVLDSGIAGAHPDLSGFVQPAPGGNCVGVGPVDDISDRDGHGTLVAGTILAAAHRAPGVTLLPVKIFDADTEPTADTAARGIDYAVAQKADIINLSFDLGLGSHALETALAAALEAGALVVMAAGNTGSNIDAYPSVPAVYARRRRERTLVVMACDWSDDKPTISNFGADTVDLAAPGVRIVSLRAQWTLERRYTRYTGTSAAAAHVSGALALLRSVAPALAPEALRRRLLDAADHGLRLKCSGGRRLNLGAALP